jgi:hypothetical protein
VDPSEQNHDARSRDLLYGFVSRTGLGCTGSRWDVLFPVSNVEYTHPKPDLVAFAMSKRRSIINL